MIVKCVSLGSFDSQEKGDRVLASYRDSGVEAVELVLSDHGMFAVDAPREDFHVVFRQLKEYGLSVASLTSDLYQQHHFASPQESCRRRVGQITGNLLERAAWLECPMIRFDAALVDGATPGSGGVSYEQALAAVFDGLLVWTELAEKSGVKLACHASSGNFLRSPVEARDLIDRLNSPAVGVALRVSDLRGSAELSDWIESLSYRLACIVLTEQHFRASRPMPGGGEVYQGDGARILALLDQVGYGGPAVCEFAAESNHFPTAWSAFTSKV